MKSCDIKLGKMYKRKQGYMSYLLAGLNYIIPLKRVQYSDLCIIYDMRTNKICDIELVDGTINDLFELVTEYE